MEAVALACLLSRSYERAGRRRGNRDGSASQRAAEWCHVVCRELRDEKDSLAKTRMLGGETKLFNYSTIILIRSSRDGHSPGPKTFSPDLWRSKDWPLFSSPHGKVPTPTKSTLIAMTRHAPRCTGTALPQMQASCSSCAWRRVTSKATLQKHDGATDTSFLEVLPLEPY